MDVYLSEIQKVDASVTADSNSSKKKARRLEVRAGSVEGAGAAGWAAADDHHVALNLNSGQTVTMRLRYHR